MKLTTLSLFLLLGIPNLFSQESEFLILSHSAEKPNDNYFMSIFSRKKSLELAKNDTLILLHRSGEMFQVVGEGKLKSDELESRLGNTVGSLEKADGIFEFGKQFKKPKYSYHAGNHNYLPNSLNPFPGSKKLSLYGDSCFVSWKYNKDAFKLKENTLVLTDFNDNELLSIVSDGDEVAFSTLGLKSMTKTNLGFSYFLQMRNEKQKNSLQMMIVKLYENQAREEITESLSELGRENFLAHATYFEASGLFIDAYFAYKHFAEKNPTNELAQTLFRHFLKRRYYYPVNF